MNKLMLFARLTKIDQEKREVHGIAVAEVPDKAGEIFDYETSKAYFQEWSNEISKATDGQNLGNVRLMHGKAAVGKLTKLDFDDEHKVIPVVAKVVDDAAWKLCLERVITGFSIGGSYVKKWTDAAKKTLQRYTARPSEISLVDNPCVPVSHFTMVKADGTEKEVEFNTAPGLRHELEVHATNIETIQKLADFYGEEPELQALGDEADMPDVVKALGVLADRLGGEGDSEKVAARSDVSPKSGESKYGNVAYADEKNKKYPIDTAEHIQAAWKYIHKPKNAGKYSADDLKTIKGKIVAAWKKKISADGPPAAKSAEDLMERSMYQVQSLADIVNNLSYLCDSLAREAASEMDDSPLPAKCRELTMAAGELLRELVDEETAELEAVPPIMLAVSAGALRKIADDEGRPEDVRKRFKDSADALSERLKKATVESMLALPEHWTQEQTADFCKRFYLPQAAPVDDGLSKQIGGDETIRKAIQIEEGENVLDAMQKLAAEVVELRAVKQKYDALPQDRKVRLRVVSKGEDYVEPTVDEAEIEKKAQAELERINAIEDQEKRAIELAKIGIRANMRALL